MTHAAGGLGGGLSPPARGGIPESLLEEAAYEAHRLAATTLPEDVKQAFVRMRSRESEELPKHVLGAIVENFGPFIVDGDCTGASLAALAIEKVNPNFAREYAKLPDHVLKRIGEIDRTLAHEVIVGKPGRK